MGLLQCATCSDVAAHIAQNPATFGQHASEKLYRVKKEEYHSKIILKSLTSGLFWRKDVHIFHARPSFFRLQEMYCDELAAPLATG